MRVLDRAADRHEAKAACRGNAPCASHLDDLAAHRRARARKTPRLEPDDAAQAVDGAEVDERAADPRLTVEESASRLDHADVGERPARRLVERPEAFGAHRHSEPRHTDDPLG